MKQGLAQRFQPDHEDNEHDYADEDYDEHGNLIEWSEEDGSAAVWGQEERYEGEDWNEYEIVAQGNKVSLRLNGELMSEVDDQDEKMACRKGIIALQMHKGPPMKVQFKALRIKVLK